MDFALEQLVFAITTSSPFNERSRVVLRPIRSIVPVVWSYSDGVAALERLVEQDRERREQVGENALRRKADGDAADAEAATSAVTLTPRLSRMTMIAIANKATLTSTRMTASALPTAVSLGSSPALRLITPRISSRAQIAPWSAKAMMNRMSSSRSMRAGTAA